MAMLNDGRTIPELFTDLVTQLSTLVRKEIQLAKAEASEKLTAAMSGLGIIVGGAILMIAALGILLEGIGQLITYLGVPAQWSYLIVGVVAVIIGFVLIKVGANSLSADKLTPKKTVEQLQRDAAVAKEQVR
jgi:TRAP-type C4-dicarboxylate transport system permease small subunit